MSPQGKQDSVDNSPGEVASDCRNDQVTDDKPILTQDEPWSERPCQRHDQPESTSPSASPGSRVSKMEKDPFGFMEWFRAIESIVHRSSSLRSHRMALRRGPGRSDRSMIEVADLFIALNQGRNDKGSAS